MKRLLAVILLVGISVNSVAGEIEDNQKACDDGVAIGCKNLGDFYYKSKGEKQEYTEAVKYYDRACNGGYAGGCSALALMYEEGQGVSKDDAKAVKLYAKACEGYDFNGCYRSGMMYKKGFGGTKQDYLKAKEFFNKACKDGDPRAPEIYEEMSAVPCTQGGASEQLLETKQEEVAHVGNVDEEGLSKVKLNGKWGIVNTAGKWILEPKYDDILYGQENLIVDINGWIKVKRNGKWGAVNTEGKWIFKPQFDDVASFTVQGQLTVKQNGKWGFMDTQGKWVLEPKYDDVYDFAELDATGFGRIILNGKEGYISDVDGLLMEPILYKNKYSPNLESIFVLQRTGLLKVGSRYDKWGIVDRKGNWILKQRFDDIKIIADQIYVKFGDKEGYTSLDGKYLTFTKDELHIEDLKKACNTGNANRCYELAHKYDKGQSMKIDTSSPQEILWENCKQGNAEECYSLGFIYAYELSGRYNAENFRHYPFVCYGEKSKNDIGKITYQECIRSNLKCSSINRVHFGEYPNDLKAHNAFKRCSKGDPKFVDPQGR